MSFVGYNENFIKISYIFYYYNRASAIGILDNPFIKVVEWMWLAFAIIILIMLIGLRVSMSNLRKQARRQQKYNYNPNKIYVN